MKIIDLLNKIANGEEVPTKIKIDSCIYTFEWSDKEESYYDEKNEVYLLEVLYSNQDDLTREIEILDDEEKGLPEKLENEHEFYSYAKYEENKNEIDKIVYILKAINLVEEKIGNLNNSINEIIDYLEKQRKGNEDEQN